MNLSLNPEIEQRIVEQVRLGHFPTPEAVVEAAVSELTEMRFDDSLVADDIAAINEAEQRKSTEARGLISTRCERRFVTVWQKVIAFYRLIIAPKAVADLAAIHDYISEEAPENTTVVVSCTIHHGLFWNFSRIPRLTCGGTTHRPQASRQICLYSSLHRATLECPRRW